MKNSYIFIFIIVSIITIVSLAVSHRTEYSRQMDPSGHYTAIRTYSTYSSWLPMTPGSSSDKPGFIKIVDTTGESQGEIPLPMLQMGEIEWRAGGADLSLIGEWDFTHKTCFYWSDNGNRKITVR